MKLDPHTMMVMIAALSLMLSGLLALAGLHTRFVRGVGHWAAASFCISISLGFSVMHLVPATAGWWIVAGTALLAAGAGLQYVGIQAFMDKTPDWRIPLLVVGVMTAQAIWFVLIDFNSNARAMANSAVLASISAICARMLLVPASQPLRTAAWLTGASFAALALVNLARVLMIAISPEHDYALYAQMPINRISFLVSSISQLCLGFGFVLMLNYRLADELQHLAAHDALTGAFNRRSLGDEAERLLARCSRVGEILTVMMIDVDHFKSINDRFGHAAGDEVLRRLAALVRETIRVGDYFARYGGEEFCILLPNTSEAQSGVLAERLRLRYSELDLHFGGNLLQSTISIGVADSRHAGTNFSGLFAAADEALYRAKQDGRNRVESYSVMRNSTEPIMASS